MEMTIVNNGPPVFFWLSDLKVFYFSIHYKHFMSRLWNYIKLNLYYNLSVFSWREGCFLGRTGTAITLVHSIERQAVNKILGHSKPGTKARSQVLSVDPENMGNSGTLALTAFSPCTMPLVKWIIFSLIKSKFELLIPYQLSSEENTVFVWLLFCSIN